MSDRPSGGPRIRDHRASAIRVFVFRLAGDRGVESREQQRGLQIDGVVEFAGRYCLLEAKWEKANLAASELFSFLGKVEGKFFGTIGLFVSRNPLTPNFEPFAMSASTTRSPGREQTDSAASARAAGCQGGQSPIKGTLSS